MIKILINIDWLDRSKSSNNILYIAESTRNGNHALNYNVITVEPKFTDTFIYWANQNLKSSYEYKDHDGEYDYQQGYICFDNNEDATLFRLTWEYLK